MKIIESLKVLKNLHKKTKVFTLIILFILCTEIFGRFFIFNLWSNNTSFLSFIYDNRIEIKNSIRDFIYTREIKSESFKNSQISKIKNIRRPSECYKDVEPFEPRIEYIPIYITNHPQFEQMKYAFFVVLRMYAWLVYFDFMFNSIGYFFKNASSSHNQDML